MKIIAALLFLSLPLFPAARNGNIHGTVTDQESGDPLAGVNILLKNTFMGTTSNQRGVFQISDLSVGDFTLIISMIGYEKKTIPAVTVNPGRTTVLEIKLIRDILAGSEVIVTASRKKQDIMEVPLSVSVISPRELREKSVTDLSEILPFIPGLFTVNGQVNIRGASGYTLGAGDRSLLLLDGVPLLGSASGNITWAVIPTSEIEQVEIVKSGGSALYGSSALGGVINVLTRNAPSRPETRFRLKTGLYSEPEYDKWKWRDSPGVYNILELTHSRPVGNHSAWVRMQTNNSDGFNQLGWKKSYNLTGKIKYNFGQAYTGSIFGNYYADQVGLSSLWKNAAHPFEAPQGAKKDRSEGSKLNINGFFNILYSSGTILKIKSGLYDVHWQNYSSTNDDFADENKLFGEIQLSTDRGNSTQITTGLVIQKTRVEARAFGDHSSLTLAGYMLTRLRFLKRLTITAGARFDYYTVDGNLLNQKLSPQLAFNLRQSDWLSWRASVSKGFRVPTVAEMFISSQLNVFKLEPNPDLEAETSTSYEIGLSLVHAGNWWISNIKIDGAVFSSTFDGLVEPILGDDGIIHFENITRARISGSEIGIKQNLFGDLIFLNMAYTWLNPVKINEQGQIIDTLSYRYRHNLAASWGTRLGRFTGLIESRYSSRIEKVQLFPENKRTGQDKRVPIYIWNFSMAYNLRSWDIIFRVDNLFQYYYTELERNMGPERNISISLTRIFLSRN
ncbi:MAG: TonB-dependent receptor [Candidatus Neomarinimicrobiota bacterium]